MEIDAPNGHAAPAALPSDLITLNVSSQRITTAKSTLRTSLYFRSLISRWEEGMETLPDGSVFIDADAEVFGIVLNYMRRPTVYPLLWTDVKGFDHAMYTRVMAEADFFMLEDLRDWIKEKKYLKAVVVTHKTGIRAATERAWGYPPYDIVTNEPVVDVEHVNNMEGERVELVKCFSLDMPGEGGYQCPDNIPYHYCGNMCVDDDCIDPQWANDEAYMLPRETIPKSTVCIWKITKLDMSACYKS